MSQSTHITKKSQANLDTYFKHAQPSLSNQPARTNFEAAPADFPHPSLSSALNGTSREATLVNCSLTRPSTAFSQESHTSSLSPPPASPIDQYAVPSPPNKPTASSNEAGRVIKSSDDEDEDSDSSLEDLATLLRSNRYASRPNPDDRGIHPSTPIASRTILQAFHISPMPILNKNKFDLKSLANLAEMDRKTEASSKRLKAMQEASERKEIVLPRGDSASEKLKHSSLLQDVVADQEDADISKVARAVMRTEATLLEQRWYFFRTETSPSKPRRKPFPTKCLPQVWQSDLKDAQTREQTFVSGFAEDMVSFGTPLPDEIFLWLLDEICVESSELLRASYCNVVGQSSAQVCRLIVPNVIRSLFERVGASSAATATTDKIQPGQNLSAPYARRDWSKLRSLIQLLGHIAKDFQASLYALTLLLRMCCDRVVMHNVDIFDLVQETINRLCRHVPGDSWDSCCHSICTTLFESVDQPTLRLQMVQCTPSFSPRSHDLKRRMAMSFYFEHLSYSSTQSHLVMDVDKFIGRLEDQDFDTGSQTDYRELAALIQLLNIALDDGRSIGQNLEDAHTAIRYDKAIDELAGMIKGVMNSIGNPGAAFISRIEAKEVLELVSQRISDTLRSKPKAKITVFDPAKVAEKHEEDLEKEKKFMASFFKI